MEALVHVGRVAREGPDGARAHTARRLDQNHVGAEICEDLPADERSFIGEVENAVWAQHPAPPYRARRRAYHGWGATRQPAIVGRQRSLGAMPAMRAVSAAMSSKSWER